MRNDNLLYELSFPNSAMAAAYEVSAAKKPNSIGEKQQWYISRDVSIDDMPFFLEKEDLKLQKVVTSL